jgi:hypothetical protein
MSSDLAQRLLLLAAATLVGLVAALAVLEIRDREHQAAEPASVPAPGGGWYSALAGPYSVRPRKRRTDCGYLVTRHPLLGVAHPVLPCGAKLTLRIGRRLVLTQVVDRDPGARNREFGITRPLARRLGLSTVERIRWRFAAP